LLCLVLGVRARVRVGVSPWLCLVLGVRVRVRVGVSPWLCLALPLTLGE
jgi:hypothetical protein